MLSQLAVSDAWTLETRPVLFLSSGMIQFESRDGERKTGIDFPVLFPLIWQGLRSGYRGIGRIQKAMAADKLSDSVDKENPSG